MAEWPKTIYVKGIGVAINSWNEFDELVQRYGAEGPLVIGSSSEKPPASDRKGTKLNHTDASLLERFADAGKSGVPTKDIGPVLGKKGKAIRAALDAWSRKIGLVTEDRASAFESSKGAKGRGFRLVGVYVRSAKSMLEGK
jgi:hypothetical protein